MQRWLRWAGCSSRTSRCEWLLACPLCWEVFGQLATERAVPAGGSRMRSYQLVACHAMHAAPCTLRLVCFEDICDSTHLC